MPRQAREKSGPCTNLYGLFLSKLNNFKHLETLKTILRSIPVCFAGRSRITRSAATIRFTSGTPGMAARSPLRSRKPQGYPTQCD